MCVRIFCSTGRFYYRLSWLYYTCAQAPSVLEIAVGEVLAHLLEHPTFLLLALLVALLTLLDLRPGALGVGEVLAHLLEHLHVRATSAHSPSVTS
jgi:hypothetical protein